MQLHILHYTFLQKRKQRIKQADIRQMFKMLVTSHMDSAVVPKEQQ
jgi:prephenate dehydratase